MLADVAGYSRLMERDEAGTHQRLCALRAELIDPAVARYAGRCVRSKGDDVLVEFASAVQAAACAVEILRGLALRNRDVAPDARLELRIGINLGDILIDGDEIAGDGVNVAARLQTLAAAGEIAISRAVREQLRQFDGLRLFDAGCHRVKNISRPIHVYTLVPAEAAPRAAWRHRRRRAGRVLRWAGVAAAVALTVWLAQPRDVGPPPQLLAVLPATAPATARSQLAQQLTAELTDALSRMLKGSVVAPSVVAAFASPRVDARDAGRRLNVRYLVEPLLAEADGHMQVAARLVGADSGAQLWHGSFEVVPEAAAPSDLLGRFGNMLAAAVHRAELARLTAAGAHDDPGFIVLRANARLPTTTSEEALDAVRDDYARALALAPEHVGALAGLASTLASEADRAADMAQARALFRQADEYSLRAVAVGPGDFEAWRVRATVLQLQGKLTAASEAIERSLALNPYAAESHAQRGLVLFSAGDGERAIAAYEQAIRLNPDSEVVGVYLYHRCRAQLYLGRYAEAIDTCTRSTAYAPEWTDYMMLTAAFAMHGEAERAAQARSELLRRRPSFRIGWLVDEAPEMDTVLRRQRDAHLVAGLRKAGVPE